MHLVPWQIIPVDGTSYRVQLAIRERVVISERLVGLAHDCLHSSQRGPSVAGTATLAQRFRRYCDLAHLQRPNPIFRDGHHLASRTD